MKLGLKLLEKIRLPVFLNREDIVFILYTLTYCSNYAEETHLSKYELEKMNQIKGKLNASKAASIFRKTNTR